MKLARCGWVALACLVLAFAARAQNRSDIWWNPFESGWGLTIADHDTQLFAVWYTYGPDRQPTWFVIPGGTFDAARTLFTGDVYRTTGPAYTALPFDSSRVASARAGTATIDFAAPGAPAGSAVFTSTIDGITQTKTIQRQPFGNGFPWWGSDRTDIWWNPNESGWGLTLAQHGNNVFGVWFTYNAAGKPSFVVMPGATFDGPSRFTGTLYTTTGPSYAGPFNPAEVAATQVGSATLAFDGDSGTFTTTVNGFSQSHSIVRQPFGRAGPVDPNPGGETWRQSGIAAGFLADGLPAGTGTLIMSEVVRLSDGSYRMYFTGGHLGGSGSDIWLADSPDASTWTVRAKVLAGNANTSDPEYEVQGASLVHLADGRWRMYYDATPAFDPAAGIPPSFQMFSAVSSDGVTFVREGVRMPNASFAPGAPFSEIGHGRVVPLDGGGYEAYWSAKPAAASAPQGVYEFHSDDGLTFSDPRLVLGVVHDPVVVKMSGGYVMYADPSPITGSPSPVDHGVQLSSTDGLAWSAPRNVAFLDGYGSRLPLGSVSPPTMGDLGAVLLGNGKLRLFSNFDVQNIAYYDLAFGP